jgi:hypothetical protein
LRDRPISMHQIPPRMLHSRFREQQ